MATNTAHGLILVGTKPTAAATSDEWLTWYVGTYIPSLVGGPIRNATAWELDGSPAPGGPGPGHSHVSRIDFAGDAITAVAALTDRVAALRAADALHPAHAETWSSGWTSHSAHDALLPYDSPPTAMITAEVMCTDPGREAEWDAWYDEQHVPDMLTSNAFATATRWRRILPRLTGCNDLTVYEVNDSDVAEAVRRSAAIMPDLIATGRKHPCHTGGRTMGLNRAWQ